MTIAKLPPEVASQIAAGEVVERPASVVKELLENAIDAGASRVEITVVDAGRTLIEVADNGSGIPADQLSLAVERHATSKLSSAEELFHIATLGFRGEALASIGSVSRMSLTSTVDGEGAGTRIRVEGGIAAKPEAVGAPQGTLVRVEDLFYNVPARLKFLKKDVTERRQISEFVTRYAIAYPDVAISLRHNDKVALQTPGGGDRREVLVALYGAEIGRQLLDLEAWHEDFKVEGFISPPELTRSNRKEITLFVNGRWIQDAALSTALVQAYHTLLMVGRYPIAILFIELPPETVDVNVHPAKAEIRFRDRSKVFADLQRSVRRALLAYAPVPGLGTQTAVRWESPQSSGPGGRSNWGGGAGQVGSYGFGGQGNLPFTQPSASDVPAQAAFPEPGRIPLLRLIGQIASAYLVAEGPDGLYLVDQHAAHERVLFEKFMAQRTTDDIPSQALLAPISVELPPHQAELIGGQLEMLTRLGFEVEDFGQNTFRVRSIPMLLADLSPEAALRVLVEDFEEDETPLQSRIEEKIIARVCKRAAVKAGHILSGEEQEILLRDLEACDSPRTCPHGRPTMIHLSVDLLERQFGRKGAR